MLQTLFHKTDLLKSFVPLSQNGQTCLEILLIQPKTQKVEGRGFFNDPDFVLEACGQLAGRYQFALSPYAFQPESIANRQAYNQFDRSFLDGKHQDQGIPHSLSVSFQFKPELYQDLDPAKGNHILQVVYLIDGILERIPLKTFCLDFAATAMTARFLPACAGHYPDLSRTQYLEITHKLVERIEKEMYPQEHKKFSVTAMALGKAWDPLPGTPLVAAGEDGQTMPASSAGALQMANEALFQKIFEDAVQGPKTRNQELYAPANLQGLSQNWEAVEPEGGLLGRDLGGKNRQAVQPKTVEKSEVGLKDRRALEELADHFRSVAAARWHWPLPSQAFSRHHRGIACGETLILQSHPFGAKTCLHFLLQAAESWSREKGTQILVFSKRHGAGELALFGLSRQLKHHPFATRTGHAPLDPQALAEQFMSAYPCSPIYIDCAPAETWEHVIRYLEHDYLVRSKKNGATPVPLAILIDGVEDFQLSSPSETFRQMAEMKNRLRDLNAALWLIDPRLDPRIQTSPTASAIMGLADYLLKLDFDGLLSHPNETSEAWEFSFPLDPNLRANSAELSLVRVTFQAHGSHRQRVSSYAHWGQVGLFKEIAVEAKGSSNMSAASA